MSRPELPEDYPALFTNRYVVDIKAAELVNLD